MSIVFEANQPIGGIVAQFPSAALLFKKYRIDFCCGGDRPLAEAIRDKGLDVLAVTAELNEAYAEARKRKEQGTEWQTAGYDKLVDHIVITHHNYLKQELGELGEFVNRIHHVHGSRHPELAKLDDMYRAFHQELVEHMEKEERLIFPMVKEFAVTGSRDALAQAVAVIRELEEEHKVAGDLLSDMRDVTNDYLLPADACATYMVSFQKLVEVEDDMFQHIHLENNILFPRLEEELNAS